ncbi:MAG: DciA family protein [Halochromatium sp.]|uniref:DciA family protein n=1 Tax=Halochromatium sp. TaxID=2049430 RepID=UPI00397AF994
MPKPTSHVRRHLRASKPIAALLDEIERRERLLSEIRGYLPAEMARHCCQASLLAGELTLFVDSPVWVERFRFLCCERIASLKAAGIEVERCRVRVLPHTARAVPRPPPSRPRAESAGDGPDSRGADDSDLTLALARLARTLNRTSF